MGEIRIGDVKKHVVRALDNLSKEEKELDGYAMIILVDDHSGITGQFDLLDLFRALLSFLVKRNVINPEIADGILEIVKGHYAEKCCLSFIKRGKEVN